ncbi:glycosyl hydrolase [Mucisphaera sp.]|uniref:glycosyl hydrolase n=1 Tax=Mucisphaera sp. TaxID=2913024 RepID=UPI003D0CA3BE
MYSSNGFIRSDIGDVDVVYHDGVFHLFHLVLPNHDVIAHAISSDGMQWRRVPNAMFVGDPGCWDDDMLWTMHVTKDPASEEGWRMLYTGLQRKEAGRVQRIGAAKSDDLMNWQRVDCETHEPRPGKNEYPLAAPGKWYESSPDEGRQWVSFRDPFLFEHEGQRRLLFSARTNQGPLIRRGCVGQAREVAPDVFEFGPPLYQPGLYDDVEVPGLYKVGDRFFLLGSIREDVKVHYWYADTPNGPFENYADNVLLPKGNYAARCCHDGRGWLIFNFFSIGSPDDGRKNFLPPPKRLDVNPQGRLCLRSYEHFDNLEVKPAEPTDPGQYRRLFGNTYGRVELIEGGVQLSCQSGYEAFVVKSTHRDFRLRCRIQLDGAGKCGLVLRIDEEANGYFLSLDLFKGVAQIRAWGASALAQGESAFEYRQLQAGYFVPSPGEPAELEVIAYGQYLECSLNGYVLLTLVDERYAEGAVGFYAESASLRVQEMRIAELHEPESELF